MVNFREIEKQAAAIMGLITAYGFHNPFIAVTHANNAAETLWILVNQSPKPLESSSPETQYRLLKVALERVLNQPAYTISITSKERHQEASALSSHLPSWETLQKMAIPLCYVVEYAFQQQAAWASILPKPITTDYIARQKDTIEKILKALGYTHPFIGALNHKGEGVTLFVEDNLKRDNLIHGESSNPFTKQKAVTGFKEWYIKNHPNPSVADIRTIEDFEWSCTAYVRYNNALSALVTNAACCQEWLANLPDLTKSNDESHFVINKTLVCERLRNFLDYMKSIELENTQKKLRARHDEECSQFASIITEAEKVSPNNAACLQAKIEQIQQRFASVRHNLLKQMLVKQYFGIVGEIRKQLPKEKVKWIDAFMFSCRQAIELGEFPPADADTLSLFSLALKKALRETRFEEDFLELYNPIKLSFLEDFAKRCQCTVEMVKFHPFNTEEMRKILSENLRSLQVEMEMIALADISSLPLGWQLFAQHQASKTSSPSSRVANGVIVANEEHFKVRANSFP